MSTAPKILWKPTEARVKSSHITAFIKYIKITQNLKSELTLKLNANNISHQYLNI
jgi:hypothetical protein